MTVYGFAAVDRQGIIDLRTVGPTARSAQVNWLVAEAGVLILQSHTDEMIATAFAAYAMPRAITVEPIIVKVAQQ